MSAAPELCKYAPPPRILEAPFPWFGGKRRAAELIWSRLGNVENYVEPFAGSLAVLLQRPHWPGYETICDRDAYVCNFWRATKYAAAEVVEWASDPVSETDLQARHEWLVEQHGFRDRMASDPAYFDARIAGWWVWGISQWTGSGWCERPDWRGRWGGLTHSRGIQAVKKQLPRPAGSRGAPGEDLRWYFTQLRQRLATTRISCGDWARVLGTSPTTELGMTGVLLDPPYACDRYKVYSEDSMFLAHEVAEWAIRHGDDPLLRIAFCGYAGEHEMPATWECCAWKAKGGYGNRANGAARANAERERVWFSPGCLKGGA